VSPARRDPNTIQIFSDAPRRWFMVE